MASEVEKEFSLWNWQKTNDLRQICLESYLSRRYRVDEYIFDFIRGKINDVTDKEFVGFLVELLIYYFTFLKTGSTLGSKTFNLSYLECSTPKEMALGIFWCFVVPYLMRRYPSVGFVDVVYPWVKFLHYLLFLAYGQFVQVWDGILDMKQQDTSMSKVRSGGHEFISRSLVFSAITDILKRVDFRLPRSNSRLKAAFANDACCGCDQDLNVVPRYLQTHVVILIVFLVSNWKRAVFGVNNISCEIY